MILVFVLSHQSHCHFYQTLLGLLYHVKIIIFESKMNFVTSTPSQPQEGQVGLKIGNSTSLEGYIYKAVRTHLEQFILSQIVRYLEAGRWEVRSWKRARRRLERSASFSRKIEGTKMEILGHLSVTSKEYQGRSKFSLSSRSCCCCRYWVEATTTS